MGSILEVQEQLRKVYDVAQEPATEVPLCVQVLEWLSLAQEYLAAATLVSQHAEDVWLPRLQLTGHAVELALKACLAAADVSPPNDHDLVKLYVSVAELG